MTLTLLADSGHQYAVPTAGAGGGSRSDTRSGPGAGAG